MDYKMIEKVFLLGWEACVEYIEEIKNPINYAPDRVDEYIKRKLLKIEELFIFDREKLEGGE